MLKEAVISPTPRHRLTTRLWHWINALCLLVLLMSGLTIFNAHPRLYWGEYGANNDHAWLAVGSSESGRIAKGARGHGPFRAGRPFRPITAWPMAGAGIFSLRGYSLSA